MCKKYIYMFLFIILSIVFHLSVCLAQNELSIKVKEIIPNQLVIDANCVLSVPKDSGFAYVVFPFTEGEGFQYKLNPPINNEVLAGFLLKGSACMVMQIQTNGSEEIIRVDIKNAIMQYLETLEKKKATLSINMRESLESLYQIYPSTNIIKFNSITINGLNIFKVMPETQGASQNVINLGNDDADNTVITFIKPDNPLIAMLITIFCGCVQILFSIYGILVKSMRALIIWLVMVIFVILIEVGLLIFYFLTLSNIFENESLFTLYAISSFTSVCTFIYLLIRLHSNSKPPAGKSPYSSH